MVDFSEEVVGAEERPPSLEDGVGDLEDAVVDCGVVWREARNQVVDQSVPSHPEVAVGNGADGFTKLCLQVGRDRDHEPNKLAFNGGDLVLGQLVIAILVHPVALDEVLEVEGGGQTCCRWI